MVNTDGRREQMMSDNSMSAKTVVVTGATAGIGLEAAKEFARRGARVMITARDEAKGEKAVAEITSAGEGRVLVEAVACDFSSISSIRAAAAIIKQRTDRIDVLLNNAGAVNMERSKSADGLELTFAVNHIGYFVFTDELLDLIKLSAPSRVVNVASDAHKAARKGVTFDDLERTRGYAGFSVYGETKLMNILYTRELARRIAGSGVTVNCLHPGVIASGFGLNNKGCEHLRPLGAAQARPGGADQHLFVRVPRSRWRHRRVFRQEQDREDHAFRRRRRSRPSTVGHL